MFSKFLSLQLLQVLVRPAISFNTSRALTIFDLSCQQHYLSSFPLSNHSNYTMAQQQDWRTLFVNDKFVKNYKTGEHITGQFAFSLLGQSGLVEQANNNPSEPLVVLDNACGTGIVSSILHNKLDPAVKANWKLTCGDISPGMVEYTQRRMASESWQNAEVKTVDAQDTNLPSDHFTHVVTSFGVWNHDTFLLLLVPTTSSIWRSLDSTDD